MVIMTKRSSRGVSGRCDARCYDATGKRCLCTCGGRNHGVGKNQAIVNAHQLVKELRADVTPDVEKSSYIVACSPQTWLF